MTYTDNPEYWKAFEYLRQDGCVCYGGPIAKENMGDWSPPYSYGWVVDDFGNHIKPYSQIPGWGMYEARFE